VHKKIHMFLFLLLRNMIQNPKANLIILEKMTTYPLCFQQLYFSNKNLDETEILCEDALITN
jgi:hypothetical protein